MPLNEYTSEEALDLLMRKLRERDVVLAEEVQAAIDAGKDIVETEPSPTPRRRGREYRKPVPFTAAEALEVALNALQAVLVEQPLFVLATTRNLRPTAIGVPEQPLPGWAYSNATVRGEPERLKFEDAGEEKEAVIEIQTETQITREQQPTVPLKALSEDLIRSQFERILELRKLTQV